MKHINVKRAIAIVVLSSAFWQSCTAISADYHAVCKDARDYAGCISYQSTKGRSQGQQKIKFEMSSVSDNEPALRRFHESILKKANQKNRCITLDLVCFELSNGTDQFGKPIPYGWIGYHVGEPYSIYMFPIPEAGVDLSNSTAPIGRYLVFTQLSRSLTEEIAASPTINLGSPYASTRCRRFGNSSIRQSGHGRMKIYGNNAGGIDATASGFDFDINNSGTTNCVTESGPPTIIYGTPGQRGGEVDQNINKKIVDCKEETVVSAYWMKNGKPEKAKKYISSVNGKLTTHTVFAPWYKSICDIYREGKIDYPLSAINPRTGKRHSERIIGLIREAAHKFFK